MDLVHDRASIVAEEDRISNLPDDIIHHILSFLDMKYAVQTSALSKRWKFIWTSMPNLNLNFHTFGCMHMLSKFVKHVLSHRNYSTQVSAVKLTFRGLATGFVVRRIIVYAYMHNIRQLTLIWFAKKVPKFPQYVFHSRTLKHLTLTTNHEGRYFELCRVPESAWYFPALETLNLSNLQFGGNTDKNLNLFSKCVNLKDLTLHKCLMYAVDIFNICAPQLSNLTITKPRCVAKVFNVVAPQLENLTASVVGKYFDPMQLSTEGLDSLEKVNLLFPKRNDYILMNIIPKLLDLFQKLRSAKFLIINFGIVQVLSLYLDQVLHEPCPFNNLKCLKIDKLPLSLSDYEKVCITKMVPQVRNYFLENSPTATVIDLIQVSPERVKRPRKLVDNYPTANKVAKLEVEEKQPETMAEETNNLKAKIQMLEEVNAKQKASLESKIQMFESKIQKQDEVIAEQKVKIQMLEAEKLQRVKQVSSLLAEMQT